MSAETGGPAFPQGSTNYGGMTLRDYFAAKAMQAQIASQYDVDMRGLDGWRDEFAREAYRYADAMLAARGQP